MGQDIPEHQGQPGHDRAPREQRGAQVDGGLAGLDNAIPSGEILISKTRLVQAWIETYREALPADRELAVSGQTPFAIDPLRQE